MKSFIVWLVCLIILVHGVRGCYLKDKKWNDAQKWDVRTQAVDVLQVMGQTRRLSGVKAVQIPQNVYNSMERAPQWKEHLLGDKKRVLLMTWDGCPYARAFKNSLQEVFKDAQIQKAYTLDIQVTGQMVSCGSMILPDTEKATLAELQAVLQTPCRWIMDHCMAGICIINPRTHEAVVDSSQNAGQIVPLLVGYASWDKEPLFK